MFSISTKQLVHDALRERILTGNERIKVDALKKVKFEVIYQTREAVFHRDIQTPRRELKIRRADEIRDVWIADKTLSRVFDISSQSKQKLRSKRRNKIVKIYAN